MKRMLLMLLLGAFLVVPAAAEAGANRDVAKGNGRDFFGPQFYFSATSSPLGTDPSGRVALGFLGTGQEVTFYGQVTCLRVLGGGAAIGGRVTRIEPPVALFTGTQSFLIQAFDSGKFATFADTVQYSVSTAPPPPEAGCPFPTFFTFPIGEGEIIVQDDVV
jgi:hypothetical protein